MVQRSRQAISGPAVPPAEQPASSTAISRAPLLLLPDSVTGQQPAIDDQLAAQHKLRFLRRQIQHPLGNVEGLAELTDGVAIDLGLQQLRWLGVVVGLHRSEDRRVGKASEDRE